MLVKINDVYVNPEGVAYVGRYLGARVGQLRLPPNEGEDVEIRLIGGTNLIATGDLEAIAALLGARP